MALILGLVLLPSVAFLVAAFRVHRSRPSASKMAARLSLLVVPVVLVAGSAATSALAPEAIGILVFAVWAPVGAFIALVIAVMLDRRKGAATSEPK